MTINVLLVAVLLTAIGVGYVIRGAVPSARTMASRRWMRRQSLPVEPHLEQMVEQERSRRSLFLGVGSLIGLVAAALVTIALAGVLPAIAVWVVLVGTVLGGSVGVAAHAVLVSRRRPASTVRVASSTAPQVTRYLGAIPLRLIRACAAAGAIACALSAALPVWSGPLSPALPWVTLVALVLVWAGTEFAARRLLEQPLPSSDALELSWREALRGELVRDLYSTPAGLSIVAVAVATLPAQYGEVGPADTALLGLLVLLIAVTLCLFVVAFLLMFSPVAPRLARIPDASRAG